MAGLSISRAWDETKAIVARDGNLIMSVALALIVLPQVIVGLFDPPSDMSRDPSTAAKALGILAVAISVVGQLALIRLALGPAIRVGEAIAHGVRRFVPAILALLLFGIGFALALTPVIVLLVVSGTVEAPVAGAQPTGAFAALVVAVLIVMLALAPRLMLLMPVASAESIGPIAVLKRTWAMSKGHYWRLLAFMLLILFVAVLLLLTAQLIGGVLAGVAAGEVQPMSLSALVVSLLVAIAQGAFTILSSVMLARIYAQLVGADAEVSVPSSGT